MNGQSASIEKSADHPDIWWPAMLHADLHKAAAAMSPTRWNGRLDLNSWVHRERAEIKAQGDAVVTWKCENPSNEQVERWSPRVIRDKAVSSDQVPRTQERHVFALDSAESVPMIQAMRNVHEQGRWTTPTTTNKSSLCLQSRLRRTSLAGVQPLTRSRRMAEKIFRRRPRGQRNSVVVGQEMCNLRPTRIRTLGVVSSTKTFRLNKDEHFNAIIESFWMQMTRWPTNERHSIHS